MMSKKCFAAIKAAQEVMAKIENLANEAANEPTLACKNAKEINEIASKWNRDFADCDPAWQPDQQPAPSPLQQAIALGGFIQK